jgi:hypothetical protein
VAVSDRVVDLPWSDDRVLTGVDVGCRLTCRSAGLAEAQTHRFASRI